MRRRLKIRIRIEEIFEEYKSAFGNLILTKLCYELTNSCSRSTRYVAIGRFKRPLLTISAIWGLVKIFDSFYEEFGWDSFYYDGYESVVSSADF